MRNNKQFKKQTSKTYSEGGESDFNNEHIPIIARPLQVVVREGQFDRAMKIFRSLVQKERILSTFKEHQSFEKPSDKKRRKRAERKRKLVELEMKNNNPMPRKRKMKEIREGQEDESN